MKGKVNPPADHVALREAREGRQYPDRMVQAQRYGAREGLKEARRRVRKRIVFQRA